jgi:carboxypeptidase Taq
MSEQSARTAYDKLVRHHRESALFGSAQALLHWDQRTMIPRRGHPRRAEVKGVMAGLLHRRATDPLIGEWLSEIETSALFPDPLSPEAVNLREWGRAYTKAVKIPEDLAVALARATSESESAWEQARPLNDWEGFLPHLKRVLFLKGEQTEAVGYELEPYDALLDDYEPGEKAKRLEEMFDGLKGVLLPLIDRIKGAPDQPDPDLLQGGFPVAMQESFARQVIETMGFDFSAGRLDISAHPFSVTIGPGDSRITWRPREDSFAEGFFGVVHEAGHAFYEQGLPVEHFGTPMGESVSLGVHESQSRLWENMVARSRPFWEHFYPLAVHRFGSLDAGSLDRFLFAVNRVRPGLIRVEADEVTYNLHVLLRFELELALIRGALMPEDLPGAFSEKMEKYLGLTPPDVASGAMQDVHWAAGYFGYFPTYTLGTLYAAQLMKAAGERIDDLGQRIANGDFGPLLGWLRENVHAHGMRHHPRELISVATGSEPSAVPFGEYLQRKYSELYGL